MHLPGIVDFKPRYRLAGLLFAVLFALGLLVMVKLGRFLVADRSSFTCFSTLDPTLCSVNTANAADYAMIYDMYGTLTPTPHRAVEQKTDVTPHPTGTPMYMDGSMATALAALPTSAFTPSPVASLYVTDTPRPG